MLCTDGHRGTASNEDTYGSAHEADGHSVYLEKNGIVKPSAQRGGLFFWSESRLDNVIRRLRWARTMWQARQMVAHGHFYVNGHKVDIASYLVGPSEDITVKPGSEPFVRAAIESAGEADIQVPPWLSVDNDNLRAEVLRLPAPGEIRLPFEIDVAKIIEMYTR